LALLGMQLASLGTFWIMGPNMFTAFCSRIDVYAGIGLFTAFQIFDTQNMVQEFIEGKRDHMGHAVSFYLNFINLFRRIAEVMARFYRD